MKLCIHRGTHQIGGIAAEIATETTRILIDMGDELSLDPGFVSAPLHIPGVTDANGRCDAVLFTHYHGDHTGQMLRIRPDIPLYAGALAKDIMRLSSAHSWKKDEVLCKRIETIRTFSAGMPFLIGDIQITPFGIDHSAVDSYLFLIEADGKCILYTGDFRLHGVRGKTMDKILDRRIGKVDAIITEGTTVSRTDVKTVTEWELQARVRNYLQQYKYVFVLCATTNLDRIFALARAVPRGKYCICDDYQKMLVETVSKHWSGISSFYEMPKLLSFKHHPPARFAELGGLMFVRANSKFGAIICQYDPAQSILLYSMWDGYRTKPGSTIPDFLALTDTWETLHTSGHASPEDLRHVIEKADPQLVIPMHTDAPQKMQALCPDRTVVLLKDEEELSL
ncbi:MBL fold metallo-hydrolase [Dialister succinatiphilus]|uniref:MBL fold metallo-hydrolase n=1 Tax=Dialister succinatiphilus TaxID=487173 RepID=UPI002354B0FA|nr:MBL fold metallo-hydrolase [Dialister succinatiphilus]